MVTTKACQARFGVVSALRERIHASLESFHVIGHHRVIVGYILQGRFRINFTSPVVSVLIYLRTLDSSLDAEQFNSRLGERNSARASLQSHVEGQDSLKEKDRFGERCAAHGTPEDASFIHASFMLEGGCCAERWEIMGRCLL